MSKCFHDDDFNCPNCEPEAFPGYSPESKAGFDRERLSKRFEELRRKEELWADDFITPGYHGHEVILDFVQSELTALRAKAERLERALREIALPKHTDCWRGYSAGDRNFQMSQIARRALEGK